MKRLFSAGATVLVDNRGLRLVLATIATALVLCAPATLAARAAVTDAVAAPGAAVTQANQQVADGLVWYRGMTGELSNLAGSDLTLIPPDGSGNFAPEDWINIKTDRLGVTWVLYVPPGGSPGSGWLLDKLAPDGTLIPFAGNLCASADTLTFTSDNIPVVKCGDTLDSVSADGSTTPLFTVAAGATNVSISSDGTRAAYIVGSLDGPSVGTIYIQSLPDGAPSAVPLPAEYGLSIGGSPLNPGFSLTPDDQLVYQDVSGDIVEVNTDGSGVRLLVRSAQLGEEVVSPDGNYLAYLSWPFGFVGPVLTVSNMDGSGSPVYVPGTETRSTPLLRDVVDLFAWQPDSVMGSAPTVTIADAVQQETTATVAYAESAPVSATSCWANGGEGLGPVFNETDAPCDSNHDVLSGMMPGFPDDFAVTVANGGGLARATTTLTAPPSVAITSRPPDNSSTNVTIDFKPGPLAPGKTEVTSCTLDLTPVGCSDGQANLTSVTPGTHTFSVAVQIADAGSSLAGSDQTTWTTLQAPAAPALARLKITPAAFRVSAGSGPIAIREPKVGGTMLSYSDSQTATTAFTVLRSKLGVKGKRGCGPASQRLHATTNRCTYFAPVGNFTHNDIVNATRFYFTGRLAGRALAAGRYRVQAVATNAAHATSAPLVASFRIR